LLITILALILSPCKKFWASTTK